MNMITEKICKKCGIVKPVSEYGSDKKSKDRMKYWCRTCENEKSRIWGQKNRDKKAITFKNWYKANKTGETPYKRKLREAAEAFANGLKKCACCNNTKVIAEFYADKRATDGLMSSCISCFAARGKKWTLANPDKIRAKTKRWKGKRPENLIHARMSNALYYALRRDKGNSSWLDLVNYTATDLKIHLENLFTEGMTWELFMQGAIHIDHVKPKSWFHFNSPEDEGFKQCWALSNLQPMWASENCSKHNRYEGSYKTYNPTQNDKRNNTKEDRQHYLLLRDK